MSTLTIRNLEDRLKGLLRVRAAMRGRSMEEEARQILRTVLDEQPPALSNLADRVRRRFAGLGDVQLSIPERESVRFLDLPTDILQRGTDVRRTAGGKARRHS